MRIIKAQETSFVIAVIAVIGTLAIPLQNALAQNTQEDAINAIAGGFDAITIQQSDTQIVITITKSGAVPPIVDNSTGNVTIPEEPIIIVPPNNNTGQNGTVIVPPIDNQTGNVTVPEPPVIIVDPEGNNTVVQPPSNVTVIDNDTVVVHPPDQNVTETPGNVTVVDPPVQNSTTPAPEPCDCPQGVEGAPPDIQFPNATSPIVGDNTTIEGNDTTNIIRPDTEPGEESGNGQDGSDGSNGSNGDGSNGEGG